MKTKGLRISDKKNNIVSVELSDILKEITRGNSFYWSILYLYGTGCLDDGQPMPAFEEKIKRAKNGFVLTWEELNNLAEKFWDLVDITIIGSKDKSLVKRFDNDEEMHEKCDIVIEMIDSGYWEIFAKDLDLIFRLKNKFKETELLDPNFEK